MDITTIIGQIFLPISLAITMFGMGLGLVIGDFVRLFSFPKAVLVGLCNQLLLLPLIGFAIVVLFDLNPSMAIGVMIISVCPGGPTSNSMTGPLARSDADLHTPSRPVLLQVPPTQRNRCKCHVLHGPRRRVLFGLL